MRRIRDKTENKDSETAENYTLALHTRLKVRGTDTLYMERQETRDARPLSIEALSVFADAIEEEIEQDGYKYALPVQLTLFTGLRKRLTAHYIDEWREEGKDGKQISTPKQVKCTIDPDGCYKCNQSKMGGPDGYLKPKTAQGEQRTIPITETWMDFHKNEKRQTHLNKRLDEWFAVHDNWAIGRSQQLRALYKIAVRRHDELVELHQGESENPRHIPGHGSKRKTPDIQFHDLRASWATMCIRAGIKTTTVQDWGGWKSTNMIDKYRGFVGDPTGTELDKLRGDSDQVAAPGNKDVLDAIQAADLSDKQMAQIVSNL